LDITIAILWGTGTVNVDYVRNQFNGAASDDHGGEPIPQENNDSPIIDGVPNDKNDRPILEGIIDDPDDKHVTGVVSKPNKQDTEPVKTEAVKTEPAKTEPVKTEPVKTEPVKTEPEKTHKEQNATKPVDDAEPADTKEAEKQTGAIAGGIPLRLMFIGASITLGDPPQSAYRMRLREWLVSLGNPVNCVGTVCLATGFR
jgi:hypothetical protein